MSRDFLEKKDYNEYEARTRGALTVESHRNERPSMTLFDLVLAGYLDSSYTDSTTVNVMAELEKKSKTQLELLADQASRGETLNLFFMDEFTQTNCDESLRATPGYRGCASMTSSNQFCQSWSLQFPNEHPYSNIYYRDTSEDEILTVMYFSNVMRLEHNFCRNPDGREPGTAQLSPGSTSHSWCYVTGGGESIWDYCKPKYMVPATRCFAGEPFEFNIGGWDYNKTLHKNISYLQPFQYESGLLSWLRGETDKLDPIQIEYGNLSGISNLFLERDFFGDYDNAKASDKYGQLFPERDCAHYDRDFAGAIDVQCVDR